LARAANRAAMHSGSESHDEYAGEHRRVDVPGRADVEREDTEPARLEQQESRAQREANASRCRASAARTRRAQRPGLISAIKSIARR